MSRTMAFFRGSAAKIAVFLFLAGCFVTAAAPLGTINQGDYSRTTSRIIVHEPIQLPWKSPMHWQFVQGRMQPNPSSGSASFLFYVAGVIQKETIGHFDMHRVGAVSRGLLATFLLLLSVVIAGTLRSGYPGTLAGFVVLLIACFAAHDIMFLQSLYGEFSVILGLPLLVIAVLLPAGLRRAVLLFVSLLLCGAAKVQFFYLPVVALAVVLASNRRRSIDTEFIVAIVLAQAICLLPFSGYRYADINRHNAMYQGSYLVMTDDELDRIGATPGERACIGVDAWGVRLEHVDSVRTSRGDAQCKALAKITLADTLRPYVMSPSLLPRLIVASMPVHFTVHYFHIDDRVRYLASVGGDHVGSELLRLTSQIRDRLVTPWVAAAICVLAWIAPLGPLSSACRLLSLFVVSQVPVVLLGEGVRDLSKHLAGAQYALDLLMSILLIWLLHSSVRFVRGVHERRRGAAIADGVGVETPRLGH